MSSFPEKLYRVHLLPGGRYEVAEYACAVLYPESTSKTAHASYRNGAHRFVIHEGRIDRPEGFLFTTPKLAIERYLEEMRAVVAKAEKEHAEAVGRLLRAVDALGKIEESL